MAIKITCIKKTDAYDQDTHEAIRHLGWIDDDTRKLGTNTPAEIHQWITNESGVAYIEDWQGNKSYVVARVSSSGTTLLKVVENNKETDDLLNLDECEGFFDRVPLQ
jgi:hypothetical protein